MIETLHGVDNVMDLVEERPMNLIHGRHVFRVAGFNMVLGDEGAAAISMDGGSRHYAPFRKWRYHFRENGDARALCI